MKQEIDLYLDDQPKQNKGFGRNIPSCGMNLVSLENGKIPIQVVNKTNEFLSIISLQK